MQHSIRTGFFKGGKKAGSVTDIAASPMNLRVGRVRQSAV